MPDSQAKYHHLIPQTYMSSWTHGSNTLYVEYQNELGKIKERNKEHIAGITHYHSVTVGMPFCSKADAEQFFKPLEGLAVKINGQVIVDSKEMHKNYSDFNNWEITRQDGTLVSKRQLKAKIDQIRLRDIEDLWSSKYENRWRAIRDTLESQILGSQTNFIPELDKDFLMRFFTALDWRSFKSSQFYKDAIEKVFSLIPFDDSEIPEDEREIPFCKTAADYLNHCFLLKYFREYLNDDGVMFQDAMASLEHTTFHFFVADGAIPFITSDNPAFLYKRHDGLSQGMLAITPKVLMIKCKDSLKSGKYYISHISENDVKQNNRIIRENADEFVIMKDNTNDPF